MEILESRGLDRYAEGLVKQISAIDLAEGDAKEVPEAGISVLELLIVAITGCAPKME